MVPLFPAGAAGGVEIIVLVFLFPLAILALIGYGLYRVLK